MINIESIDDLKINFKLLRYSSSLGRSPYIVSITDVNQEDHIVTYCYIWSRNGSHRHYGSPDNNGTYSRTIDELLEAGFFLLEGEEEFLAIKLGMVCSG